MKLLRYRSGGDFRKPIQTGALFESLACQAVRKVMGTANYTIKAWLEHLRLESTSFVPGPVKEEILSDEMPGAQYRTGRIPNLFQASGRYCEKLAVERSRESWRKNRAELDSSWETLKRTPGFASAERELKRVTDPVILELERTPPPAPRALELFHHQAKAMASLVSDARTRDAYVHILRDMYYPKAYCFLAGGLPERYTETFGGCCARELADRQVGLIGELDASLDRWIMEARHVDGIVTADIADNHSGIVTSFAPKPKESHAQSAIVDAQSFWDANTESLNKSIAILGSLPGYTQAYAEMCRRTESVVEKLREAGCPSINATIEYFDSHASPMLGLISEPVGRDAYLNVLIDRYYPDTYLNVLGIRPEFHARRFGGGFMSSTAAEFRHIEEVLDARLRFWYSEAFKKGGEVVLPSTPSMIREDLNDPGLCFSTRLGKNQGS